MGGVGSANRSLTLFGIPIRLDPSWFVIVGLLTWSLSHHYFPRLSPGLAATTYWGMGLIATLLLFVCVLLHELAHSLVARRFGLPVACVTLFLFGGVSQIQAGARTPRVEAAVALAGPLVSVLLAACGMGAMRMIGRPSLFLPIPVALLYYLTMVNVAVALFNLLPGFPLDGGRVVRALIWRWSGDLRGATRVASGLGVGLGVALIALGVWVVTQGRWVGGAWYVCLGIFLRNAAQASFHATTRQ